MLAVLFAAISGSTALYERLGDLEARKRVATCLPTMTEQVIHHAGVVIKTIGDELMCTFPEAGSAVHAAIAMQSALTKDSEPAAVPVMTIMPAVLASYVPR